MWQNGVSKKRLNTIPAQQHVYCPAVVNLQHFPVPVWWSLANCKCMLRIKSTPLGTGPSSVGTVVRRCALAMRSFQFSRCGATSHSSVVVPAATTDSRVEMNCVSGGAGAGGGFQSGCEDSRGWRGVGSDAEAEGSRREERGSHAQKCLQRKMNPGILCFLDRFLYFLY